MTTQQTRIQNMMFLMSLAPLSVGCIIVTDDDGDTDANDDGGTSNPTSTGGTPGTDGTDGGMETGGTDGTDGTDGGTAMPETGDETAGPETGDETAGDETTGELSELCALYGDLVGECTMNEKYGADTAMYCEALLQDYYDLGGEACQMAFEDLLACLNGLTCEELLGEDPTCEAENAAIEKACPTR